MKKAQQKFKVGDVVRLKSGGLFTILDIDTEEGLCMANEHSGRVWVPEPGKVLEPAELEGSRLASGAGEKSEPEPVIGYCNLYSTGYLGYAFNSVAEAGEHRLANHGPFRAVCRIVQLPPGATK